MSDNTAPGWRPTCTGDRSLGDVGSGHRLGTHLYYLYRAGRNELPGVARTYALLATRLQLVANEMEHLFHLPGHGIPSGHRLVLPLRDEAQDILRLTALRLQQAGRALVNTAERYARGDQAAVAEFSRLLDANADQYRAPAPAVPPPLPQPSPPPAAYQPAAGDARPR